MISMNDGYFSSPKNATEIKLNFHRDMKAYHESKQVSFDRMFTDMFHSAAADYHSSLLGFYAYRMLRQKYSIGKIIRKVRNMQQQAKKEKAAAY